VSFPFSLRGEEERLRTVGSRDDERLSAMREGRGAQRGGATARVERVRTAKPARRVSAMAEKRSCIFGISAIHGGQMARINAG
jgi:hypothetical protein